MARSRSFVGASLVLAALGLFAEPAASATSWRATYGGNSGTVTNTGVTVCDGESDSHWVRVEMTVTDYYGHSANYTYTNKGGVGCQFFSKSSTYRRRFRVCELMARTGVTGCGSWVDTRPPV